MESKNNHNSEQQKSENDNTSPVIIDNSEPAINDPDSQDTFCEVRSPSASDTENICSQDIKDGDSIYSQETEYMQTGQIEHNLLVEKDSSSSEVKMIEERIPFIILESGTESASDKIETTVLSDSSNARKECESPVSRKKIKLDAAEGSIEMIQPESTGGVDPNLLGHITVQPKNDFQPCIYESRKAQSPTGRVLNVDIALRSSPRIMAKRSNSCTPSNKIVMAGKRLKRCLSADIEHEQKKLHSAHPESNISNEKDFLHFFPKNVLVTVQECISPKIHINSREERISADVKVVTENDINSAISKVASVDSSGDSQHFISDSQNVHLHFSPTPSESSEVVNEEILKVSEASGNIAENEINLEIPKRLVSILDERLSNSNGHSGYIPISGLIGGDHDSMCSPLDSGPPALLTKMPYLSNGHTSSTPEPYTKNMLFKTMKRHGIPLSDSESDGTPIFDYNKPAYARSKRSLTPRSDTSLQRTDSSTSSLQNGHSHTEYFADASGPAPSFDVQIYCDENGEFLSLFVVKTDTDLGGDVCREYQRLSRRIAVDPYLADASKATSPSSVTSGGLLHLPAQPRSSFMSTAGSSSASSSRTSDGAFAIPQRPRKMFSGQRPVPVRGWSALRRRVDEILSSLTDAYAGDDSIEVEKRVDIENGLAEEVNRVTPKSSKKKPQTRGKRPLLTKAKKSILPITDEERDIAEAIHSPEMIPTDPERCRITEIEIGPEPSPLDGSVTSKMKERKIGAQSPSSLLPMDAVIKLESASHPEGTLVFARWVDKKYYSGKVKRCLDINKYLIEFDDGHTKPLLDDFIIFGDMRELPVSGQSVYAAVDRDQNYEPGLVLGVEPDPAGCVRYKCTTDRHSTISVTASELCLTEDQARIIKENLVPKSPQSAPGTPRKRGNRELDLDNIIQGPRSARLRDKGNTSTRKALNSSPSSPKASTSGTRGRGLRKGTPVSQRKRRQESESSEGGEAISRASSTALEEVAGVQPEVQKTPRKIDGVKALALQIKGVSKQNPGKKSSKVTKFENDKDTVSRLGPIPGDGSVIFSGLHFLLTCTDMPELKSKSDGEKRKSPLWSDNELQYNSSSPSTDKEDNPFTTIPFHKERIKEQLEMGGGTVYSHFEDIPKNKYSVCKLISPRPCLTAKYIQCLSADIKSLSHHWVIRSCQANCPVDMNEDALPAGWSIEKTRFINWKTCLYERSSASPFKDKLILVCSDNDNFTKFWDRVCSMAGANTRIINDDNLELDGGLVVVTESDCPHEVQNKAILDNIPLVSTIWVVQCLIEGKICKHDASQKYNFTYNDD